jgi:choline kinase
MRAIILAAGSGRRLAPMGWDKPKCLLRFGSQTLLDNIVASLLESGIDELAIVVGYKKELVIESLKQHPIQFNVVVNPDYEETNTINSLYLVRDYLDEDFLYFNADVLFDRAIIPRLLAYEGSVLAVEEKVCGQEEVKVIVDADRRILKIGKTFAPEECLGEFVGIGKFCRSVCPDMVASLCRYNEELHESNLFFEAAVNDILEHHFLLALSIGKLFAIEIDCPEDYLSAKRFWKSREIGC